MYKKKKKIVAYKDASKSILLTNISGRIYLNVVPIPLYLSKLRLAEVTGIKGQPNEEWTYFTSELSSMVSESVEFDTTYGNKG